MAYRKGPSGTAEKLHSEIVRMRGYCERCGATSGLECAHIVRRSWAHTRTDTANAWCLCRSCHDLVDNWDDERTAFINVTIGWFEYERLRKKALDGVRVKFDWRAEVARLHELKRQKETDGAFP